MNLRGVGIDYLACLFISASKCILTAYLHLFFFTILKLLTALVYVYIYINKDDNYVQCNMITTINVHELRS